MPLALSFERPLIMGIVNVTPDSFSGDGLMMQKDYIIAAVNQAVQMVKDGANIIDIGGESSRPGAAFISAEEEIGRVVPVIAELRQKGIKAAIAVDTIKATVAEAALAAGANIINDVSAMAHDAAMAGVAARAKAWVVLMHNRTDVDAITVDEKLGGEYKAPAYNDLLTDVSRDLLVRVAVAKQAGIAHDKIILDPGIGFGKTVKQNLALINHLDRLVALGYPVLLGASRKGFIGRVLNATVEDRLEGGAASVAIGLMRGARIFRVHDVRFTARLVAMAEAILETGSSKI